MRFSNILLVIDSDVENMHALERAIEFARNENARLTVCDVVDSIPGDYRRLVTSVTPGQVIDSVKTGKIEHIESLLGYGDSGGLSIEVKVLVGTEHIEIVRQVRESGHDLVIKPIANRHSTRARFAKRKNKELIRACPCPVWLVNVADRFDDGCIVAALDMPANGSISSVLNEHILRVSKSLALSMSRQLHVVHAWSLTGEGHMRARGTAVTDREVDRMIARETVERIGWLRNAVNVSRSDSEQIATDYLAPELHVVKGFPDKAIPGLAEKLGAGLLVMGTAARSGFPGMLIGNKSEVVMSRSDCSLLIVKQSPARTAPSETEWPGPKPSGSKETWAEQPFVGVPEPGRELTGYTV